MASAIVGAVCGLLVGLVLRCLVPARGARRHVARCGCGRRATVLTLGEPLCRRCHRFSLIRFRRDHNV